MVGSLNKISATRTMQKRPRKVKIVSQANKKEQRLENYNDINPKPRKKDKTMPTFNSTNQTSSTPFPPID
jgi:hypothetical protein